MEVVDAVDTLVCGDERRQLAHVESRRRALQQDPCGSADQASPGPEQQAGNQVRDRRVDPVGAPEHDRHSGYDDTHRAGGIAHQMECGAPDVEAAIGGAVEQQCTTTVDQ